MKTPFVNIKPENFISFIEGWINEKAFIELVENFGGKMPTGSISDKIKYLSSFSEKWDFRNKQNTSTENNENARWLIQDSNLSEKQKTLNRKITTLFSLTNNNIPNRKQYDYKRIC